MFSSSGRLLTGVVALGALLVAGFSGWLDREPAPGARKAARSPASSPSSPGAEPGLTADQARSALIGDADLGGSWTPTEGAATWRDGLLKSAAATPACQRLMDVLYADDLLGDASPPPAVVALDDGEDQAQLRYQVASRTPADVDRTLAWLRTLPQECAGFTTATVAAGPQSVQVAPAELPPLGDDRQGLRVTVTGQTPDENGEPVVLTLDVALVRVGDDAITVTTGSLGADTADTTAQALQQGTQRLTQIRQQGHLQA
ncbi:hypothetical protein AB0F77_32950 [Streptomyces sp. NPDC026672]|uniref:hypothetical protein n=1 Tax=Actinomycetes TaxID=1760 RepID=UPI0033DF4852